MFSFGSSSAPLAPPISDSDLKEIVHDRILRQAGVDYEARPILCFYACQLPNPRGADYDVLLRFMMEKLDEFVESDYVLVMFSAGAEYTPSWKWMYKAYAGLSRKYRKNLKHLYVVHPNFWSKLLIQTMAMIVSPKFARKIAWVYNLTALARVVPLKQVYIPEILYKIDESYQPRSSSRQAATGAGAGGTSSTTHTTTGRVFGAPLVHLMGTTGEKGIPLVVRDTTQYIFSHGLDTEGLFRRSPSSVELQETKMAYENDTSVDFSKAGGGVHLACGVLKSFFRDMPDPVFGEAMYDVLKGITAHTTPESQILYIRTHILPLLSPPVLLLFRHLTQLLYQVHLHANQNRMTARNLVIVWAPNLIRSDHPLRDLEMCGTGQGGGGGGTVLVVVIERWKQVFEESG